MQKLFNVKNKKIKDTKKEKKNNTEKKYWPWGERTMKAGKSKQKLSNRIEKQSPVSLVAMGFLFRSR